MMRAIPFFTLLLTSLLCSAQVGKPNIIFILADDLGIDGLSCYGADLFKTPAIDRLAKTGIRYTHAYTVPLCGPSRAMILTGRYPFRTGAVNQDQTGEFTPSQETMMPKMLKAAGYTTSMIGKWGQLPLGPAEFGFDDHLRYFGSGVYSNSEVRTHKYMVNGIQRELRRDEYMPDLMHDHLVDFLSRHRNAPFYVYYSLSQVHGVIGPTPDSRPGSTSYLELYTDNIRYMDKMVDRLVKALDSLELRENTILVFFGDNGTAGQAASIGTVQGKKIIGKKGTMEEGGSLVPMIVHWPAAIRQGSVSASLIDASDFVPTFAALCGAALPRNVAIDGRSFAHELTGRPGRSRDWVFIELGNKWYVRSADWKLDQAGVLYDMRNAPFEEKPVVSEDDSRKVKAGLQAVLDALNPRGGILDKGDGTGRHAGRNADKGN